MYHAISGGRTEAAQTVFSQALPYLVSVESDGEEGVPGYQQDTFFTFDEMAALLGDAFDLDLTAQEVERTLAVAGYTDTGRVAAMLVGDKEVEATAFRQALGLRSTWFTMSMDGSGVTFHQRGYGHGVGMSQAGANSMAADGADYRAILTHYYPGVFVEKQLKPHSWLPAGQPMPGGMCMQNNRFLEGLRRVYARYDRLMEKQGFYIVLAVCVLVILLSALYTFQLRDQWEEPPAAADTGDEALAAGGSQGAQTLSDAKALVESRGAGQLAVPTQAPLRFSQPVNGFTDRGFSVTEPQYFSKTGVWQVHPGHRLAGGVRRSGQGLACGHRGRRVGG